MLKTKLLLALFLLVLAIKSILWTGLIPIWQTPDEQAHFAQLQWYAENKNNAVGPKNLSLEVTESEKTLGTFRDQFGNNKYTYHPEYKNSIVGSIGDRGREEFNLPLETRTNYVGQEAAMYPPLYYVLDAPFYQAVYSHSLIDRVYASRILSVILSVLLVLVAYKIGFEIWGKGYKPFVLATMVGFQPMVSFVGAGIHPDNLLNLLCAIVLWLCILVLKNGVKFKYLILLSLCLFAGYETKTLMLLMGPVVGVVLAIKFFKQKVLGVLLAVGVLLAPVAVFAFQIKLPFVPYVTPSSPLYGMNFVDYLHFRIPKMFFEVWPWYWGVFKWLGLVFPPLVLKIITRVAAISVFGLIIKLAKEKNNLEKKTVIFFLLSTFSYILYLLLWDWRLMQSAGFSAGIQGRYFFPNIVAHMGIFIFGLSWGRFSKPVLLIVSGLMIALNIFALHYLYLSYN